MTTRPPYVVHHVDEKDVTIDWFFGHGRPGTKAGQLVLIVLGWFFTVLPVVITASALLHRDDEGEGWWGYQEGFAMWDQTIRFLGVLTAFFAVFFMVLYLLNRASTKERNQRKTYDEERLALRLEIADRLYADRYGPEDLRREQRNVQIQPYGDIGTYELRGRYREQGVD
jgi:hypothetical protein